MKFISIALASAFIAGATAQTVSLDTKWNLTEPEFLYDSLSFELDFEVTDFITSGMSQYSLWTAPGCQEDGTSIPKGAAGPWENTRLDDLSATLNQLTGANQNRNIALNITLDSQEVVGANTTYPGFYKEYIQNEQQFAEINFCVRFGLWTPSGLSDGGTGTIAPIEVNFLATLVTLYVDLTDGFNIGSIAVEPKDKLIRTANQAYEVIGYECSDTETSEDGNYFLAVTDAEAPRNQGEVIRICVEPEEVAKDDGIFMRSIDSFSFRRQTPNVVNQECIVGAKQSPNLLTSFNDVACVGAYQCVFETILFASFFTELGSVDGTGVASMQFGNTGAPETRRLRATDRNLQEDVAAGAAEFDLVVNVNQAGPRARNSGAGSTGLGVASAVAAIMGVASMM